MGVIGYICGCNMLSNIVIISYFKNLRLGNLC